MCIYIYIVCVCAAWYSHQVFALGSGPDAITKNCRYIDERTTKKKFQCHAHACFTHPCVSTFAEFYGSECAKMETLSDIGVNPSVCHKKFHCHRLCRGQRLGQLPFLDLWSLRFWQLGSGSSKEGDRSPGKIVRVRAISVHKALDITSHIHKSPISEVGAGWAATSKCWYGPESAIACPAPSWFALLTEFEASLCLCLCRTLSKENWTTVICRTRSMTSIACFWLSLTFSDYSDWLAQNNENINEHHTLRTKLRRGVSISYLMESHRCSSP